MLTAGVAFGELPTSVGMFQNTSWVSMLHPLGWATKLGVNVYPLANAAFVLSLPVFAVAGSIATIDPKEASVLIALLPALYTYPDLSGYRLLPLIIGLFYIATHTRPELSPVYSRYAWILSAIGAGVILPILIARSFTTMPVLYSTVVSLSFGTASTVPNTITTIISIWVVIVSVIHLTSGICAWRRIMRKSASRAAF